MMRTDLTDTFLDYVNNGGILHYRATLILNNSSKTTLQLGDDDFLQDTWEFQYDSCEGNFAVGGAVPSQFKCTLNNITGKFTNYVSYLKDSLITVYLQSVKETTRYDSTTGLVTKELAKIEEFCWGTFVVNVDAYSFYQIDLKCYDKLYLLKNTNLLEYLNSVKDDLKLNYGETTAFYIFTKLKKWLPSFGISSITSDVSVSSLVGNFLLPIEFYSSVSSPSKYKAYSTFTNTTSITDSEYDVGYRPDSEDWEDVSLLDFVMYFAQIFGEFVVMDFDGVTLKLCKYPSCKSDVCPDNHVYGIKSISFSEKSNLDVFNSIRIKTANMNYPCSIIAKYIYIDNEGGVGFRDDASSPHVLPVSTGGYEITNYTNKSFSYANITDNLLIYLPVYIPYDNTSQYISLGDIDSVNKGLYISNTLFNGKNTTGITWIDAGHIIDNLTNNVGSLKNLEVRNFQCSAIPMVELTVGDYAKFHFNPTNQYNYFGSLISHIVFTPNVKTTFSLDFDEEDKISNSNCFTYNSNLRVYPFPLLNQFAKDAYEQSQNALKNILSSRDPKGFVFYYTEKDKNKPPSGSDCKRMVKFIQSLMGDISGETGWVYELKAVMSQNLSSFYGWRLEIYARTKNVS